MLYLFNEDCTQPKATRCFPQQTKIQKTYIQDKTNKTKSMKNTHNTTYNKNKNMT